MKSLQKAFLMIFLLQKRLMKKYSFLVILGMIPVLSVCMFLAAGGESGVLHIVLCGENEQDDLAEQVIEELTGQKSILNYSVEPSADMAYQQVREGRADAAWIFSAGLADGVEAYTSYREDPAFLVTVVEREETVFLQLARERLYSALYPHLSYALFKNYITLDLAVGVEIPEEELRAEYASIQVDDGIFRFSYRNTDDRVDREAETNYLLTPLRGLLALVVLLCGFAASLYFEQDKAEKLFVQIPLGRGIFFPYLYHLPAVMDGAAAVLLTYFITHIFLSRGRELGLMALYCAACIGFCNLLRKICGTIQRLSTCIPLLMLAMVALCPIFISLRQFRMVQYLFPPFYYLQCIHNTGYIKTFLLYIAALYGLDLTAALLERYQTVGKAGKKTEIDS